jgi:soluble lytic murein transglycosylase-like protein
MIGNSFGPQLKSVLMEMLLQLLQRQMGTTNTTGSRSNPFTNRIQSTTAENDQADTPIKGASFNELVQKASQKYGVDTELIHAVIKAESNYNPKAVSKSGALGLMQLMPATAKWLGVKNSLDPAQNIDGGVKFLSRLLDHYDGNTELAVAAYNAGPGAVDKYGSIPPYRETQVYVSRVMSLMNTGEWSA